MSHYLNLLPAQRQKKAVRRRRARQWAVAVVLSVVLLSSLVAADVAERTRLTQRADALQRQYEPVAQMQSEIDDLRERLEMLRTQEQLARELSRQKSVVTLLGLLSNATRSRGDRIALNTLLLSTNRVESEQGVRYDRALRLEGVALSSGDISHFSEYLENANAFYTVHLESSSTHAYGSVEGQNYTLQCSY